MTKTNTSTKDNQSSTIKDLLTNTEIIPKNYRGLVKINQGEPVPESNTLIELEQACPTRAISTRSDGKNTVCIDNGKCIMCSKCNQIAPELIKISNRFDVAVRRRKDLVQCLLSDESLVKPYEEIGEELKNKIMKIFRRSLQIREIDAGSCNGCEIEINALNNPVYDIERFGIRFVASPRHADVLMITGPPSKNMINALKIAYESTPDPKIVIAVGACACTGGIFANSYATTDGIDKIVPVDVYIPGCPPRPQSLVYGLLLAINQLEHHT